MTATYPTERAVPGLSQQVSTRIAFFIAGFAVSSWAPLVPFAKDRANLDEGVLGLLLLSLGLGSLLTMPITGLLAGRFGCRVVIMLASLVICLTLPLLAVLSSLPALAVALFFFGAGVGTVDVAVNIQAVIVEKASGRSMMSGFHGLYSVGGIVGAAGVTALLSFGMSPLAATAVSVGIILLLLAGFARHLLPYGSESHDPLFVVPRGKVMFIGALCFIMFLAEGAMLDWSALFLTQLRGLDPARAGLGYAAFAIAMTIGRLNGDRIVQALGASQVLILGGIGAAAGLGLGVAVPSVPVTLLGFTLVGLGASNIVPVLFSAAGRQHSMPANLAIAAITTIGYAGILCGPAGIGFVAKVSSLPLALGLVALGVLAVGLVGRLALED